MGFVGQANAVLEGPQPCAKDRDAVGLQNSRSRITISKRHNRKRPFNNDLSPRVIGEIYGSYCQVTARVSWKCGHRIALLTSGIFALLASAAARAVQVAKLFALSTGSTRASRNPGRHVVGKWRLVVGLSAIVENGE
jgi:hypothetical protein